MFRIKQVIAFSFVFIVGAAQAVRVEEATTTIPYYQCIDYCLGLKNFEPKKKLPVTLLCKNNLYFITGHHGKTFQAGRFEQMTLADLRHLDVLKELRFKGSFNVLEGPANADIRKLQADPKFNGATFQVASNFNALETVDPEQDILTQSLSSYVLDPTQGPAAALGAPAGLILRRYGLFNNLADGQQISVFDLIDSWAKNAYGQLPCQKYGLGERQVNFLSNICNEQTGIEMSPAGYVRLGNAMRDPLECECGQIKIGCQRATQVVFGAIDGHPSSSNTMVEVVGPRYGGDHSRCIPPYMHKQIINQVFVAAPDFGQGTNKRSPRADAWAKLILRASCEGTLRMAHLYSSQDVVLTWVGGGAFNNDPVWVVEILEDLEPLIKELGLHVTLAAYGFTQGQEMFRSRLEALVTRTGGSWVK